ncbi:MAG: ACT domain-containing protein [Candidatus Micrarchaeia archaeon]
MAISEINKLLKEMKPQLRGEFLICSLPPELLAGELIAGAMGVFKEREGITLIIPEASRASLPKHAKASKPLVLITLGVNSDLEAVGFLAAITTALAKEKIPVNAVSAYFHDHLFVPREKAEKAMETLAALSNATSSSKKQAPS